MGRCGVGLLVSVSSASPASGVRRGPGLGMLGGLGPQIDGPFVHQWPSALQQIGPLIRASDTPDHMPERPLRNIVGLAHVGSPGAKRRAMPPHRHAPTRPTKRRSGRRRRRRCRRPRTHGLTLPNSRTTAVPCPDGALTSTCDRSRFPAPRSIRGCGMLAPAADSGASKGSSGCCQRSPRSQGCHLRSQPANRRSARSCARTPRVRVGHRNVEEAVLNHLRNSFELS